MISAYLRLAAPLQSWAGARVTGNVVRTAERPTRTALEGLLAGTLGCRRGQWPSWLTNVRLSVRTERPGQLVDEFQTINPRDEDQEFQQRLWKLTMPGKLPRTVVFTPDAAGGTAIVRRTYLADAEFLVRITDETHMGELLGALVQPAFSPYLGRKAFAPTFPFFLGVGDESLLESLPTQDQTVDESDDRPAQLRIDNLLASSDSWNTVHVPRLQRANWLESLRASLTIPSRRKGAA